MIKLKFPVKTNISFGGKNNDLVNLNDIKLSVEKVTLIRFIPYLYHAYIILGFCSFAHELEQDFSDREMALYYSLCFKVVDSR